MSARYDLFISHSRRDNTDGRVTQLNDRAKLSDLDRFPEWRDQPAAPLDVPWPD